MRCALRGHDPAVRTSQRLGEPGGRRGRRAGTVPSAFLLVAVLAGCSPAGETAPANASEEPAREPSSDEDARPVESVAGDPAPEPVDAGAWEVVEIVDGDTIDVRSADGVSERVRIIGIDTPERGECGFSEASAALASTLGGQTVTLAGGARDDRDRYDRILRYVDVDGVDAGRELIARGFAIARYDSRDGYGGHTREADYVAVDAASSAFACTASAPAPAPGPAPAGAQGPGSGPGGSWRSCAEARSAGAAPVSRSDPGYGAHLDGDDDGIGCE